MLFDIDGVIRDVAGSYRRAIQETVQHFSGWSPATEQIDTLKGEGCWNNDWEASLELLRRRRSVDPTGPWHLPTLEQVVNVFSGHYFGGDPEGDPAAWGGLIGNEPLLVEPAFFDGLSQAGCAWGFVSGAEPPSARFVLESRLGLAQPAVIAMGDAPDKPDPTGLLQLAADLLRRAGWGGLGADAPPVAYLGDTVADVQTVQRARQRRNDQRFISLAVAPPHLHGPGQTGARGRYEQLLLQAGADHILPSTPALASQLERWLPPSGQG
ncbi:MAG: TIGR01548 family HAD-type hydrolase [Cyanobacteriota bacterium]|nr:TIGR01548 family HAD-type hydrolase [Cyanobacteriota bacterium]